MRSTIGQGVRRKDLRASLSVMFMAPSSLRTHQRKTLSALSASAPFLTTTAACMAFFRKRVGLSRHAMSLWRVPYCGASQSGTNDSWSADATGKPICFPSTRTRCLTPQAQQSARRQRSGWSRAAGREAVRHSRIRPSSWPPSGRAGRPRPWHPLPTIRIGNSRCTA
jgi:hypothetical protein